MPRNSGRYIPEEEAKAKQLFAEAESNGKHAVAPALVAIAGKSGGAIVSTGRVVVWKDYLPVARKALRSRND